MQITVGIVIIFVITLFIACLQLQLMKRRKLTDDATGALNSFAFEKNVNNKLKRNIEFDVLVLINKNKTISREKQISEFRKLAPSVAADLKKKAGRNNVYYLQSGRFAVILPRTVQDRISYSERLVNRLQKMFLDNNVDIKHYMAASIIKVPVEANNVEEVYKFITYLEIMPSLDGSKIFEGKNLDIAYMNRFDEIDRAIDRALKNESFEVFYQPIYSILGGKVVAVEALLRLSDVELGKIAPAEFIPIAENTGKINDIGKLVLRKVCEFLSKNDIERYNVNYIEVNLSATECMQEGLPEYIAELLDSYSIARNRIHLEIAETAITSNNPVIVENLEKLNDLDIGLTLDDYGSGDATFKNVMTLPFNSVKIDRTMLWNAMESQRAMYALCASINMLRDMDTKIVVEGAESEEMVEKLRQLKCDWVQGFYFAHPMASNDFVEFIANN